MVKKPINNRFLNIKSTTPSALIIMNEDGIIQSVNSVMIEIFGYKSNELVGKNVNILMPEPDSSQHDSYLKQYYQTGISKIINSNRNIVALKKNGETFSANLSVHEHVQNDIRYFSGIITDRSDNKNEKLLLNLISSALEAADNAIMITDKHGNIQWINSSFTKLTGFSQAECIGQNPRFLKSDFHGRRFYQNLWRTILSGKVWSGRIKNKRKNGELFDEETTITPVTDDNGNLSNFIAIKQDITKRIKLEEEKAKLLVEMEHKNEEMEQYAYTISHDLKSPLVTIAGFLAMMKKDLNSQRFDRLLKDISRIESAATTMQNLLDDLLELSRVGKLDRKPEELEMNQIFNEALNITMSPQRAEKVKINIQPELPLAFAEKKGIFEVCLNLLDNAFKFLGGNKNPQIDIGFDTNKGFFVKDNGIGIAKEHHSQIFKVFDRLNYDIVGTGIGLSLVKRIIETNNGIISLVSQKNEGSTFYFTLPLVGTNNNQSIEKI